MRGDLLVHSRQLPMPQWRQQAPHGGVRRRYGEHDIPNGHGHLCRLSSVISINAYGSEAKACACAAHTPKASKCTHLQSKDPQAERVQGAQWFCWGEPLFPWQWRPTTGWPLQPPPSRAAWPPGAYQDPGQGGAPAAQHGNQTVHAIQHDIMLHNMHHTRTASMTLLTCPRSAECGGRCTPPLGCPPVHPPAPGAIM